MDGRTLGLMVTACLLCSVWACGGPPQGIVGAPLDLVLKPKPPKKPWFRTESCPQGPIQVPTTQEVCHYRRYKRDHSLIALGQGTQHELDGKWQGELTRRLEIKLRAAMDSYTEEMYNICLQRLENACHPGLTTRALDSGKHLQQTVAKINGDIAQIQSRDTTYLAERVHRLRAAMKEAQRAWRAEQNSSKKRYLKQEYRRHRRRYSRAQRHYQATSKGEARRLWTKLNTLLKTENLPRHEASTVREAIAHLKRGDLKLALNYYPWSDRSGGGLLVPLEPQPVLHQVIELLKKIVKKLDRPLVLDIKEISIDGARGLQVAP